MLCSFVVRPNRPSRARSTRQHPCAFKRRFFVSSSTVPSSDRPDPSPAGADVGGELGGALLAGAADDDGGRLAGGLLEGGGLEVGAVEAGALAGGLLEGGGLEVGAVEAGALADGLLAGGFEDGGAWSSLNSRSAARTRSSLFGSSGAPCPM
jgi:hypothetical protein